MEITPDLGVSNYLTQPFLEINRFTVSVWLWPASHAPVGATVCFNLINY